MDPLSGVAPRSKFSKLGGGVIVGMDRTGAVVTGVVVVGVGIGRCRGSGGEQKSGSVGGSGHGGKCRGRGTRSVFFPFLFSRSR